MLRGRLRRLGEELTAESMRAATLVGVASIPVGLLAIALWGTGSATAMMFAGVVVGFLYADRPTPAHRAGARAGLFAPLPEIVVQLYPATVDLWATSGSLEVTIAMTVLFVVLGSLVLWVFGAVVCIVAAVITDWILDLVRPFVPGFEDLGS